MAQREKFGKLVLLEESDASGLGQEYRAAKLGPAGLEKIVTILRLGPAISSHADIARSLMDQAKVAAQLQNPHILKIFGIGKVEQTYYISYEFTEGKSLGAILERCRQESFPLQIEHSLLIASKVCSALEYAHGRKSDSGRFFHGFLTPGSILVSYEGEIRVKGFGYWPSRVREVLASEDLRYLAPEQRSGPGEPASDLFALGVILFEALTGQVPSEGVDAQRLASAKLASPQGDDDSIPGPVAEILRRSLAADPADRYPDVADMRKALDTLLFSGDFSPTTFNLAFFMHSLYREDIEREAKRLKEDREASYLEFLTEEVARPAPPVRPASVPVPLAAAQTEPLDAGAIAARGVTQTQTPPPAPQPGPPVAPPAASGPPGARARHDEQNQGVAPKEAAAGFTFHKEAKKSKGVPLAVPLGLVLLLGGGAAYYFLGMKAQVAPPVPPPTSAPATLSAEALAAEARIKELEDKLRALEEEKAAAATKAADEAKKRVESQAAAKGQAVDPAAVEKAQEEARRKSKAEQEKRQQEELRRLEEQKKAEEARVADEKRRADELAKAEAAAAAAAATPPPTEAPPTAAPATAAPVKPGTLVGISDAGVVGPVAERQPRLVYPPIALWQKVGGVVELSVLVDETGKVADVTVITPAGGKAGLTEAAVDNVKRRHYRPATKDGVPVRVWINVRVRFELPK
ncbi:MAG TPA: TonB family protein [Vicinamibacteria bacterium]